MDYVPSVCPIEPRELLDFCADSGYHCRLEPRGSLLIPPDYNVGVTDWERSIHLRYACCSPDMILLESCCANVACNNGPACRRCSSGKIKAY